MRNTGFNMVVSLPDGETKHYSLNTDEIKIGRGPGNQITIPVGCVSSRHCEISCSEEGLFSLIDLGSKNGTEINGIKAIKDEPITLNDGDYILFGQTVYAQIVEVSDLIAENTGETDIEVGKALAELTQKESTHVPPEEGATTRQIIEEEPVDLDEEYDDIAINPVAAAVAKATRAFTSE